ncbi:hypothetical protein LA080_000165 [Diaporthe eres]|nr:hypothetical protein LA080_000165 [Diaporthe eres]
MKRTHSPPELHASGVSGAHPDKKQRMATSDAPTSPRALPPQPIHQDPAGPDFADPDSADLEAATSVTEEDSAASESGCSSACEEDNESDQKNLSYLCDRCLRVDFDNIFSRRNIESGGDPILWFYSEHKVLDDPRCTFCQAMQFIHPSLDTLPEWKKRRAPLVVATVQDKASREDEWVAAEDRICLTFGYHQEPPSTFHKIYRWTKENVELRNSGPDDYQFTHEWVGYLAEKRTIGADKNALPAVSIKPKANFGMIKERLRECREEHEECRSNRGGRIQSVPGMRLIDCRTRTIVSAPEGDVSYAALSYVWGTSEIVEDDRDELPDRLPKTISDTILVTRKLKIRYLWIDRYCIRQKPQTKEEENEQHGQIARMHHIYGGSSMTIIAAAGHGPDHGLPGVSTRRRPPPVVRLPDRTLFATLPDPKLLVDTSAWSTRGWTFQEGLLARRRLVFTDQQVYFECGETGDAEAWEECHEEEMFRYFDPTQNTPLHPYFSLGNGGYASIWPRINDYSKLSLGDPRKDILNGILGVLTHYEEAFADALSWECDDPGQRRAGFPTWSWTGWTCKGFERNERGNCISPDRVRAWSISIERLADESTDHSDVVPLLGRGHDLSQVEFLRVTAPSLEAEIIPMDGIPEDQHYWTENDIWDADGFDNNEKKLGVRYSGVEEVSFINLTDSSLLTLPLPYGKTRCFAIIADEDRLDIPDDQLGKYGRSGVEPRHHATVLLVVAKENGFEKERPRAFPLANSTNQISSFFPPHIVDVGQLLQQLEVMIHVDWITAALFSNTFMKIMSCPD